MAYAEEIISEDHQLTASNESSKSVVLNRTPDNMSEVMINIIEGSSQEYGIDYYISGDEVRWNGMELDGDLEEGDIIRAFYAIETSLNLFTSFPERNGIPVTSFINNEALLALTGSDPLFDSIEKILRVDVTYEHELDRQKETILHWGPGPLLFGDINFSIFSRSGRWLKTQIRVKDLDGAVISFGRYDLGSSQDLFLV